MRHAVTPLLRAALGAALACGDVTGDEGAARATKPATATLPDDSSNQADADPRSTPVSNAAPPTTVVDASIPDATPSLPFQTPKSCFKALEGPVGGPDYDQFAPKMGTHCVGTHQQTIPIQGVERLVFLGDSITTGTPPNLPNQIYRELVTKGVKARFGPNVQVSDCSRWGARNWDLLGKPGTAQTGQVQQCFPSGVETKKTLVVMTMGGNDIAAWADDQLAGPAAMAEADASSTLLGNALAWLKDPAHFPNGSSVIFGNVYEFTDTSGDLHACPTSGVAGLKPNYAQGTAAIVHFQEQYMKQAVASGADMVFLLENFCGHGYKRNDPKLQCYRGPNTDLWFDLTCIHPNRIGHSKIAEYVLKVIDG